MITRKKLRAIVAGVLAVTALSVGAAVAANGDQNDPLITLSYLNQTVLPSLVTQVESKAAARQEALTASFNEKIAAYKKEVESILGGGGAGGASYVVVDLSAGERLAMDVGCEVMLRVGSATVSAATSPALINITSGGSINGGAALQPNNLYMASIADRSIQATSASVKLLVRGGYSIL